MPRFLVSDYALCRGNDADDDSVGINRAIGDCNAVGGGEVLFEGGQDARLKHPVIMLPGVSLRGPGGINIGSAFRGATLRPAANLSAMVTQADISNAIDCIGLSGLTIDGRKEAFSVADLVHLSPINSRFQNNNVGNGTGNGFRWSGNSSSAWVNWVQDNEIGGCGGWGLVVDGSDSIVSGNYISGSASGGVALRGAIRFVTNQVECSPLGIKIVCGSAQTPTTNIVQGNFIAQNGTGLYLQNETGANVVSADVLEGNAFIANVSQDVYVEPHIIDGVIGRNQHRHSNPATAHLAMSGNSNSGWTFVGGAKLRVTSKPTDMIVLQ